MTRSIIARLALPSLLSLLVTLAVAQAAGQPPARPLDRPGPGPARTGTRPEIGPPNAPVTLEVWGSMQCPYTAKFIQDIDTVLRSFPKVKVVWRSFPLAFHNRSMPAAIAAEEVFRQKGHAAFWAFLKVVMANQRALDDASLVAWARQAGADGARVAAALSASTHRAIIEVEQKAGTAAGVKGTPNFLVNGKPIQGGYGQFADFETRLRAVVP